jgi:hypothetical protein
MAAMAAMAVTLLRTLPQQLRWKRLLICWSLVKRSVDTIEQNLLTMSKQQVALTMFLDHTTFANRKRNAVLL